MFKSRLPLLLVFNKADIASAELCRDWMADFQKFHAALDSDSTYAATLSRSLSMVWCAAALKYPAFGVPGHRV